MLDLSEEVRASVAKRLWKTPIFTISTIESDLKSDNEVRGPCRKWMMLKSGKIFWADLMVLKKVTWPHDLVYTAEGKPVQYENLSVSLFVSHGYSEASLTVNSEEVFERTDVRL